MKAEQIAKLKHLPQKEKQQMQHQAKAKLKKELKKKRNNVHQESNVHHLNLLKQIKMLQILINY